MPKIIGVSAGVIGLYFLLAGEISVDEVIAVLPVLVLALLYTHALRQARSVTMRVGAHGAWRLVRSLARVPPELWQVGHALLRAIVERPSAMQGVVKRVPFRFGALTAEDVGRRAAVVTAISLAPNGIALGMDHEGDELMVHQLVPQAVGGNWEWPG